MVGDVTDVEIIFNEKGSKVRKYSSTMLGGGCHEWRGIALRVLIGPAGSGLLE